MEWMCEKFAVYEKTELSKIYLMSFLFRQIDF